MKKILNYIAFLLGLDCETRRKAVDQKICNFEGQGKDEYGN